MIAKALRRAKTRYGLFIIAALLFTSGVLGAVGLTSAIFQARFDSKTATFAGGYVAVPTISTVYPATAFLTTTAVTSTLGGNDGVLVWTNGKDETTTNNEIQQIFGADRSTTNNCTGATYATTVLSSTTSPTTTQAYTYTDTGRATVAGVANGDWYCYEVVHGWPNTTAPDWTTPATTNVQLGLAPTGVTITNSGTAGTITNGDKVVITYNQPVTTTTTATHICQIRTSGTGADTIILGDTGAGGCAGAGDAYTVGELTGLTLGGAAGHAGMTATVAVSGNTVTLTVTTNAGGRTVAQIAGTTAFVSSTTTKSADTTRQATACTAATANCTLKSNTSPYHLTGNF